MSKDIKYVIDLLNKLENEDEDFVNGLIKHIKSLDSDCISVVKQIGKRIEKYPYQIIEYYVKCNNRSVVVVSENVLGEVEISEIDRRLVINIMKKYLPGINKYIRDN